MLDVEQLLVGFAGAADVACAEAGFGEGEIAVDAARADAAEDGGAIETCLGHRQALRTELDLCEVGAEVVVQNGKGLADCH
ncbi:MAG TPA: hypothetical protein VJN18_00855 [Polyangiaceae bacterium]|nr:hypothetical protein [Polyangiaceae bacterium]